MLRSTLGTAPRTTARTTARTASGLLLGSTLALAALLPVAPALAQDAPPNMRPTRDVAVTYRMAGPQGTQEMRMAWAVAAGKQRVEPPGNQGWMLVDQNAGTATMVMDAQRMVMALPPQTAAAVTQGVPPGARFARKGTAQVAGQTCTEWDVTMTQGRTTICMTEDGVMLRAAGETANGAGRLEATEVRYGAQDPARFQVPAGYQSMQMSMQPTGTTPGQGAPGQPAPAAPPAR